MMQRMRSRILQINELNNVEDPGILFEKFLKDIGIIGNELKVIKRSFERLKFYRKKMQAKIKPNQLGVNDKDARSRKMKLDSDVNDKETIEMLANEKILLQELINDKKDIPIKCSQSMLYEVLIIGLLFKHPILISEYETLADSKIHTLCTKEKLMEKIIELRNKISEENRLKSDINNIFTNIESNKNNLFDNLISLKKELLGIDVRDLQRLIEKTKKAENDIAGKSIVLFIGDTGSGKTTTILGLYGFTMVNKKFKGMDWVTPLQTITDEKLKLLHTSPQQKSITRYPLAILPKQRISNTQQLWFLDTPGFGDSAGVEVDLANGIGTINTIKKCKSVRSIVIISKQSWGARGAGIKKLAKLLGSLFGNYRNVQETVMFIWNRFLQGELRQLHIKIKNLIQNLTPQQKVNQNLKYLLEDLADKTQYLDEIVHYNLLIQHSYKPILKKIKKSKELQNPGQYFNLSFTQTTYLKLRQQCSIYKDIINYHFDNNNIEQVAYFLKNYNRFQLIVRMAQLKQQYRVLIDYLSNSIKSRFSNESQNLCRKMKSFNLSVDDINKFSKQVLEIEKYKVLDKLLVGLPNSNKYMQILQQQTEMLVKQLKEQECAEMKKILETLKLVKNKYSLKELKEIEQILNKKLTKLKQDYTQGIYQNSEESFTKAAKIFEKYNRILKMLSQYLGEGLKPKNQLINILPNYIKNEISKMNLNQQSIKITQQNCKKWNALQQKLDKINHHQIMILHNEIVQLKKSIHQFKDQLSKIVINASQLINKMIQELKQGTTHEYSIDTLSDKFKQFQLLKQINAVRQIVEMKIDQRTEKMQMYLNAQRNTLKEIQSGIENKSNKNSKLKKQLKNLQTALTVIQKLSRFECQEIRKNGTQLINTVIQNLVLYLNENQAQLATISINFREKEEIIHNQLDKITKIMSEIEIFANASKRLPENTIKQIQQSGTKIIKNVIEQLDKQIQEFIKKGKIQQNPYQNVNLKIIDKGVYFLNNANSQLRDFMNKQISEIRLKYQKELQKFKIYIFKEISETIKKILIVVKQIDIQYQNDVRKVKKRIDILKQIMNIHKNIKYFAFQDIEIEFNTIKESLEQFYTKQKTEWQKIKKNQMINEKIILNKRYRILSIFDKLFTEFNFNQLSKEITQNIQKINTNIHGNIKQYLDKKNFILLTRQLKTLSINKVNSEGQTAFNQALILIETRIHTIVKQINQKNLRRNRVSKIDITFDLDYFQQLQQLTAIKSSISQFISKQSNIIPIIQETIKNMSEIIKLLFENCAAEVQELIQEQNLPVAQAKCNELKIYEQIIKSSLQQTMKRQFKFTNQKQERHKRWKIEKRQNKIRINQSKLISHKLQVQIKERLDDFSMKYLNLQDDQKIDDNFEIMYRKILERQDEKSVKSYKQLKLKIDEKSIDRLKRKIQKIKNQKNLKYQQRLINQFNLELQKMPKVISQRFTTKLQSCKQDKKSQRATQINQVQQIFNDKDNLNMNQIYRIFDEADKNENQSLKKTIKSHVNSIIQQILKEINNQNIQVKKIYQIFKDKIYPFYYYNKKNYFQELIKKYLMLFARIIKNKLQKYGKQIKQRSRISKNQQQSDNDYQSDNMSANSKRISHQILIYFQNLLEIFVFIKNNEEVKLLEEPFLAQFKNKVTFYWDQYLQSINYIKDKFNNLERQIEIAQEYSKHFTILDKISDAIMSIANQIQTIQNKKQYQIQPQLIYIKNEIEKIQKFSEVKEKFIFKFQAIQKQLLNFSFENDDIINANDAIRNDQLFQISNKLAFIKNYEIIYLNTQNNQVRGNNRYDKCEQNIKMKIFKISKENNQILLLIEQKQRIDEEKLQKFNINIKILKLCQFRFFNLIISTENFQKHENIKKQIHKIIIDHKKQAENYIITLINNIDKNKIQLSKLTNKKLKQIQQVTAKLSVQYKKKLYEKIKSFQQRIKNEQDEMDQLNIKNQKDSELSAIKTQERDEIKKIQYRIRTQEEKQKQIIQHTVNNLRISLAQLLVKLKMFSIYIFEFRNEFNQAIKYILDQYEKKCGKKQFRSLAFAIDSLKNTHGARILSEQQKFNGFKMEKFKRNMENIGIKQVIQQLGLNLDQKQKLNRKYQQYKQKYYQNLKFYSNSPNISTIYNLKQNIKAHSQLVKEDLKKLKPHSGHELIAYIFALWTILKADVTEQGVEYLYQPHPAQIVAIFCILGMSEKGSLGNRFAEVLTGEGKSIILAGLVAYLACVGYQVNCVCYSKYLSDRDQKLFKELFEQLSINDYIKYGTFNEICQDLFNSQSVKLRENIQTILLDPQSNKLLIFYNYIKDKLNQIQKQIKNIFNSTSSREKILLIDEVDVFFSQDFYGNLYLPYIGINKPIIQKLINFIWTNRQSPQLYAQTLNSQQYNTSIQQFPSLKDLIFEAVKGMIRSVNNWNHQYIVLNKKIAYKQHDGISFKTNYGYNTIFAYFYECQRSNISILSRQEASEIGLTIGEFSYSMLPKYFKHIMGVTGTLKILSDVKKKICVEEYNIKEHFYIPSVYGKSRREHKGIKIIPEIIHRQQIVNETKNILDEGRSVLIFFETARQASEFHISNQFQSMKSKSVVLNQQHDDDTKIYRINRATIPGNITIMTKSFGRGTDFVIYSEQLRNRGGIHVIQTFLSEQESEQIQIMGRVARQGDLGSYSLILNASDLERINLKAQIENGKVAINQIDNLDEQEVVKKILNQKRNEAYNKKYQVSISNAKKYEKNHQRSMKMINNLMQKKYKEVVEYIKNLNSFPEIFKTKSIKTILALDATGSMSDVLASTASIIGIAFQNAQKVIKSKKPEATFELQIAIYRNYNCKAQELFSYTPFECKPENISRFLRNVQAIGGWGNQALEILYNHINKQVDVDQVIIIGDAPANSYQETELKRDKQHGQKYWKNTQYNLALNAEVEFKKIIKRNINIHTFYIGNSAKQYFHRISNDTKGQCKQLKPNQKNAQEELTDFIAKNILDKIGGKILLQEYQAVIVKARHK